MTPRATQLVGIAAICATVVVGCGNTESESADEAAQQSTVDVFAPPTLAEGEVDWGRKHLEISERLIVPNDEAESATWVREYLSIYEHAYETCGGLFDFDSPSFNAAPENVFETELSVTENARQTNERAAWVAWQGCRDGRSDYPFPIPEVQHLQRLP